MTQKVDTILLIDDDIAINYFHKRLFSKTNLSDTVLPFYNGKQGLDGLLELNKSLSENNCVFIFLDINMPVMDGWELLEELNANPSKIHFKYKIFILSSSINPDDIKKAEANKLVVKYMSKPLNQTDIDVLRANYL